jgi:hypothetical protein
MRIFVSILILPKQEIFHCTLQLQQGSRGTVANWSRFSGGGGGLQRNAEQLVMGKTFPVNICAYSVDVNIPIIFVH